MRNIYFPNLPQSRVTAVFADCRLSPECRAALKRMDIAVCEVPKSESLAEPVCAHPDMRLVHLSERVWLTDGSIHPERWKICSDSIFEPWGGGEQKAPRAYPEDIPLNCAIFGENIILNAKYASRRILSFAREKRLRIIDVKQGYGKCAVCIVDKNAIITEDEGIGRAACSFADTLLLKTRGVRLDGYRFGFIGGACGKLDRDLLAFTGRIETHPEFREIEAFCGKRGVEVMSLGSGELYDYGSLLPVKETGIEA